MTAVNIWTLCFSSIYRIATHLKWRCECSHLPWMLYWRVEVEDQECRSSQLFSLIFDVNKYSSIWIIELILFLLLYFLSLLAPAVYCTWQPHYSNVLTKVPSWKKMFLLTQDTRQVVWCQSNSPLNEKSCNICKGAEEMHWFLQSVFLLLADVYSFCGGDPLMTHTCPCVIQMQLFYSKQIHSSRKPLMVILHWTEHWRKFTTQKPSKRFENLLPVFPAVR